MKYISLVIAALLLGACGGGGSSGGEPDGRPTPPPIQEVPFNDFLEDMMSSGVSDTSEPVGFESVKFTYEDDRDVDHWEF